MSAPNIRVVIIIILASTIIFAAFISLKQRPSNQQIYNSNCSWEFDYYEQSQYEMLWFSRVNNDTVGANACDILFDDNNYIETLLLENSTVNLTLGKTLHKEAEKFYSRMYYKEVCSGTDSSLVGVQLIEPLFGILRDPCDVFCRKKSCFGLEGNSRQSKKHILTITASPYRVTSRKRNTEDYFSNTGWNYGIAPWYCSSRFSCLKTDSTLMDIGASYFNNWHDSGAGAGSWLYSQYQEKNIILKNYFAYEAERLNTSEVYKQIPQDLLIGYRWINLPASAERNNKLNPWTILKSLREGEYPKLIIVKLDIDSPNIENSLVDQLLESNGTIAKLVSEFFYEHHVNLAPLNGAWGSGGSKITLLDSYKMFKQLRDYGVRSHSWP